VLVSEVDVSGGRYKTHTLTTPSSPYLRGRR
jgi:hypothetical protein